MTAQSGAAPLRHLAPVACLLLALVGLAPAQAQMVETLVSNTGQATQFQNGAGDNIRRSQPFETGSVTDGYTLHSISLRFEAVTIDSRRLTVALYASDSDAGPSNLLHTLTNPSPVRPRGLNEFSAPAGVVLTADTRYHVVLEYSPGSFARAGWSLADPGLDPGAADGWDIPRSRYEQTGGAPWSGSWSLTANAPFVIAVKGTAIAPSLPTVAVASVATPVAEGEDAQFTVTRTGLTAGALTVNYRVSETGEMVASGEEGAQSVDFGDGDTEQTVTVPTVEDTGHEADSTVTLTLTADAAYELGTATADVVVEDDDNADPTGAPTISDTTPVVGDTLTADPSGIDDADGLTGAAYTYRWLRVASGGTETQVGTGQSYTVVAADVDATLKVEASFTDDDGTDETVESAATATVTALPMVAVAPVASPVAEGEDAQFRVTRTVVTAGALTVNYRVSETGEMVASGEEGAQSVDFGDGDTEQVVTVPTVEDTGHEADSTVTLTLTADAAYRLGTATADVVVEDDDNADPTGAPTISDTTPVVGDTLTADPSGIADADGLTGAAYTYRWLRVAPGGTETQVGTGQSYTVVAGDVGATLKVEASFTDDDGTAESVTSDETAPVADANAAPTFADTAVTRSVAENAVAGTNVGAPVVATDADGDPLTYTLSGTGSGNFAVDANGQITVGTGAALDHETLGSYTLTLSVRDGKDAQGNADTAEDASIEVTVNVTDVDEAPVADAGAPQTVAEGAAVTLTGTGTDPEGEAVTYAWSQTGGTPTVTLTGADTASASFTAPTQLAQDAALTFTLTVTDAQGATDTDTVTVTVTAGANDAPVADAGTPQTVAEGAAVTLTGTGTDPEGESLTYAWSQTGGTPSVTLTGADTASASFTAPTQLVQDTTLTFTLTVTDARGATGTDTVTVTITAGSNDAPVADAGTPQTVGEGAAVTLTGTGTDPEGESLTYAWLQTGGTPSVTLTGADTASASFTAPTQLTADAVLTFTLTVTDARGATGTDTVTVTVTAGSNDAPVADAGTPQTVGEGAAVTLTGTGTDPEGESLTYAWSQTGGTPSVTLTGADTASASFTAPTQLVQDTTLMFTLTVTDARGATGTDTVTVTVTAGTNDAPVADAGTPQTVGEGAAVTLTGTGTDPEGESLTYAWSQTGGTPSVTLTGADTASASFTAPTQLVQDTTLTFTLTVTDARGATGTDTVTVTITAGSNDAPVADAGAAQTVGEGAAVTLTGTGTDPEGESLTYAWSQTGGTPSVTLTGADTASASFTAPTQLVQDTTLTFTLTVTDARGATGTDTVTVTITAGSNDAPVADAGAAQTVGEGAAVTLTGTGTDPEGESLTYAWSQTGGTPSVTLTGADTASASFTAPVQLTQDAVLTFTLSVTDARGATGTDTVTVTITAGSNDAPVADAGAPQTVGEGVTVTLTGTGTDPEGESLTYAWSQTGGTPSVTLTGADTASASFTAPTQLVQDTTLTFTLTVTDARGATGTDTVTVTVTAGANDAPVADAGTPQTVGEGAAVTLTGTGTDPEGESLTYAWSQTGGTPSVTLTGADTASASFTAPTQLVQDTTLTFTLSVTDARGATGTDTVTVTITAGSNDAPVADAGAPQTVGEGVTVTLTGTGTDPEGESLTYAWSQTGGTPSVTLTGADTASASFTAPTQLTQDTTLTFTLTVTDARGATGTDTVTVTVTAGANDAPVADAGAPQMVGEGVTVTLTGTGTDPEGESLSYAWSQTGGTPSVTLTGADTASASFTAPTQLVQDTTLTFTLTVTDARGATGTDTVTVTITAGSNDAPVADAGAPQTVGEGVTVTLTGTGTDPEGESLTYAWSQTGGTPSVTLTGTDTASASFTAPVQLTENTVLMFTLSVTDARGATGTDTVTVTITAGSNDAPVADAGAPQTAGEGAAVTLTGTGTDAEGESLSYAWSQTGGTPSVTLTGADTASASFTAPVQLTEDAVLTFTLTVTDARGATGTDAVTVTITAGSNDAPVAAAGAPQTVGEGAAVTLAGTGTDPEGESLSYAWSQTGGTPSVTLMGADTASVSFTAPTQLTEDTTLTFTLTVTDVRGATGTDTVTVTVTRTPGADATLSGLSLSAGTLGLAFDPLTTTYTASVSNDVASLTLTPTANDTNATLTVNGNAVTSGQASVAIALEVGDNVITIEVTAEDGSTARTYTLTVTRKKVLPTFTRDSETRRIAENSAAGTPVGAPVAATGGAPLSYALGGADAAAFSIDADTGQLRARAALNYEAKSSYSVTVTASDGVDTAEARVSIQVTDVAEQAGAPGTFTVVAGADAMTLSARWSAASAAGGPAIAGYELELRTGEEAFGDRRLAAADAQHLVVDGLAPGTAYDLRLRAVNGETPSAWVEASGTTSLPPMVQVGFARASWETAEGETLALALTVSGAPERTAPVRVRYELLAGTALAPDYEDEGGGEVEIGADAVSGLIRVRVLADGLSEQAESFEVRLLEATFAPGVATLDAARSLALATIAASDPLTVSLSGPSQVLRGATGSYEVRLAGGEPTEAVRVGIELDAASSAEQSDVEGLPGSVTVPAGARSARFELSFTIAGADAGREEQLTLRLGELSGGGGALSADAGASSVTTTILSVNLAARAELLETGLAAFGRSVARGVADALRQRGPHRRLAAGGKAQLAGVDLAWEDPEVLAWNLATRLGEGYSTGSWSADGSFALGGSLASVGPLASGGSPGLTAGGLSAGAAGPRLSLGATGSCGGLGGTTSPARCGTSVGERDPDAALRRLLSGTRFDLALDDDEQGDGVAAWRLWGRGEVSSFNEDEGLSGDLLSGQVGLDYQVSPSWLAGLALNRSDGWLERDASRYEGDLDVSLTSVHPYSHWTPRPGLGIWASLGYGWGEVRLEDVSGSAQSDLALHVVAFGVDQALTSFGGLDWSLRGDGVMAWLDTEGDAARQLPGASAVARQWRLALAGHFAVPLGDGAPLLGTVELGGRVDEGDASSGASAELGGDLAYVNAGLGLEVQGQGRVLLSHEASGFEDWGASLTVSYDAGVAGRGLQLSLAPTWGRSDRNLENLWRADGSWLLGTAGAGGVREGYGAASLHLTARVAYGIAVGAGRLLTPFQEWRDAAGFTETRRGANLALTAAPLLPGMDAELALFEERVRRYGFEASHFALEARLQRQLRDLGGLQLFTRARNDGDYEFGLDLGLRF